MNQLMRFYDTIRFTIIDPVYKKINYIEIHIDF